MTVKIKVMKNLKTQKKIFLGKQETDVKILAWLYCINLVLKEKNIFYEKPKKISNFPFF